MAVHTFSAAPTNASDAAFRAWGSAISTALAAVGMVKTSDTGQIDWGTVSTPAPTNNSVAGYEVWRFDDDLQDDCPIFFKLEYGSSAGSTNTAGARVRMWLTVGKGSNGAGTITGTLFERTAIGTTNTQNNSAGTHSDLLDGYASSCAGKACVIMFPFANGPSIGNILPAFIIERSRNNQGEPTGDGLMVAVQAGDGTGQNTSGTRTIFAAINYAAAVSNIGAVPVTMPYTMSGATVSGASTLASGVIGPVVPWQAYAPGIAPWQPRAGVSYLEGDLIAGVTTIRLAGRDSEYRTIPVTPGYCGWGLNIQGGGTGVVARVGVAILWEDEDD